jgi:DNA (cytosine-5)-methyltransferase 1
MMTLRFVDLFAGLGGFHHALSRLKFECVFASEIDDRLRDIYVRNFTKSCNYTFGDIREYKDKVPPHDILCAGFPCQPFSKSGAQKGVLDKIRGTLFEEIIEILGRHNPEYILLENVGNFERHDYGRTWKIVQESLQKLGYNVRGTEHIGSGGSGLLSPHHFGFPHSRERFFIIGRLGELPQNPFPRPNRNTLTDINTIIQPAHTLTDNDSQETALNKSQFQCIEHWNTFLRLIPKEIQLPSFPLWGDEIDAIYPYEKSTPFKSNEQTLRKSVRAFKDPDGLTREELIALLPSYARTEDIHFPKWKIDFIRQNREWFNHNRVHLTDEWVQKLRTFTASHRKLEWNCKGDERDLWQHILQFRPSGLRVKRFTSSPALVAMTSTQIPILGPQRRFITRTEGLRLQGFPDNQVLPETYHASFKALGNAVHVDVIERIARNLILGEEQALEDTQSGIYKQIMLERLEKEEENATKSLAAAHID